MDLYIKGHIKLRVYNIYLYANPALKEERITLQNDILISINNGLNANFHIVIMGNFNANLDTYKKKVLNNNSIPWNYHLIHSLVNLNFIDLYEISNNIPKPT